MTGHADIQLMLYEYVRDELSPQDRAAVANHISICNDCALELDSVRETLTLLPPPATLPSEQRTQEFWSAFAAAFGGKMTVQERARKNPFAEIIDWVEDTLLLRPRLVYAVSGSLAMMIAALAVWTFSPRTNVDVAGNMRGSGPASLEHTSRTPGATIDVPNQRVSQYFRKSKMLLVGLTNMKTDVAEPMDFTTEQRISRDLIHEARYLKRQPLDSRSQRLVSDLEKILIQLENIKSQHDLPDVEIIRGGIHQENLLFKTRMAEARYDSAYLVAAPDNR